MYNTLELGSAGTEEWLAASAEMTLLNKSFSGVPTYSSLDGEGMFAVGQFHITAPTFDQT